MEMWVLTGADTEAISTRRRELLDVSGDREDCDCADDNGDALVSAVASISMFGDRRLVACEHLEKISDANLERLCATMAGSDARVVARCDELPAAMAKKLTAAGVTVEKHAAARGRDVAGRIQEIADRYKIRLGAEQRKLLVDRAGHDLERVRSMCWQLATVEAFSPSVRQLQTLLGTTAAPGVPWAVTDAMDRGDTAGALRACNDADSGLAVLAYLATQLTNAARLVEAGVTDPAGAEQLLGIKRFPAEKACSLARRLGKDGVRSGWEVLSQAETQAKTGVGERAALELAVARLCPLWSGRTAA